MDLSTYTPIRYYGRNELGKDFVVGDIHGCFTRLIEALDAIGFDYNKDRLFAVGDLVDRGPESAEVLKWLTEPWFHSVRGNHDNMVAEEDYITSDFHVINGGAWFRVMTKEKQAPYREALSKLPYLIEVDTPSGKVGIAHANIPCNDWEKAKKDVENIVPSKHQGLYRSLTYLDIILEDRSRLEYQIDATVVNVHKVYFGHTPLKGKVPYQLGNCVFIDHGVFKGNEFRIIELT